MLDFLLKKMDFQYNDWIKPNKTMHLCYFFIDWENTAPLPNPGVIGCTSKQGQSPSLKSLTPEPPLPS